LTVGDSPIGLPDRETELVLELICWSAADERILLFAQIPPTGFLLHRIASGVEVRAALSCWIL
jgi:hypothetical protein